MSNFLVCYDFQVRGGKQVRKLACVVPALTPQEAKKKILDKPRKSTEKITRLRASRLTP